MKQQIATAVFLAIIIGVFVSLIPSNPIIYDALSPEKQQALVVAPSHDEIKAFLESKDSPLASHVDTLLEQEHWKLLVAISAIESQYCKRQLGNNCWGITSVKGGYKEYSSFDEALIDANGLITRWQARGRWHTVEDMNCHYVVPCNPTWVEVVHYVLDQLESYE